MWLNVFHLYLVRWWIFSSMCLPCSYLVWPWKELWFKDEPLRFHSLLKPRSSVITQTLHKTFKSIVKTITIIKHFRCPDWCHDSDDGWKWSYGWTRGRRGLGAMAGHKVLLRKYYCWPKFHCLSWRFVLMHLNFSRSLDNRTWSFKSFGPDDTDYWLPLHIFPINLIGNALFRRQPGCGTTSSEPYEVGFLCGSRRRVCAPMRTASVLLSWLIGSTRVCRRTLTLVRTSRGTKLYSSSKSSIGAASLFFCEYFLHLHSCTQGRCFGKC